METPSQSEFDELIGETADAPTVVAVVVTTNPGEYFSTCLESLVNQDYDGLSLLVIDSGSDTPVAERVAEIAPEAFVHRISNDPGRAKAANLAIELVSEADFFVFSHDDVAFDAHAVSAMLEEAYRSNAGILGPKLVRWDDRRLLSQVGMGADRFGVQVDLIEPGDYDQQQYDSVRDTFLVPSAVQLVRADLFRALGGYDPAQPDFGDDLDLCWRAQVAGARIIVVPSAICRHAGEELTRSSVEDRRRALSRGRLRSMLVSSSGTSRLHLVPLAVLLVLAEALYALAAGRARQALGLISGLGWNLARMDEIRSRRGELAELRKISDREIRTQQVGGSARVSSFIRERIGNPGGKVVGFFGQVRNSLDADNAGIVRDGMILSALAVVMLFFGSRHLLTRPIDMVGLFPEVSSAPALFKEWWSGWRSPGLSGEGHAPTAFLLLALGRFVLLGSDRLVNLALVVGPIFVGTFWMWRLVRPFGSQRAAGVSAVLYLSTPLVSVAMANGRWDALVIWSAMPVMLGSLFRLIGLEPFGPRTESAGSGVALRPYSVRLVRWGLVVFFVSIFVPAAIGIGVILCLVGGVVSMIIGRPKGIPKLLLGSGVAIVVPVVLNLPWSFDILSRGSMEWLVGPPSPYTNFDSMADLVRFAPGPINPNSLALALLIAAGVVLVVGRGRRFDAGAMAWSLSVTCFFLIWADRRGWVPVALPAPEVLLSIPAAGLAMAVGVGVRSVESDLAAFRFGWRQVAAVVGSGAILVATFTGLTSTLNGRWKLPVNGYGPTVAALAGRDEGSVRSLWIGDPGVMPIDTLTSDGGVSYAVTEGASLDALYRWTPGAYGDTAEIGKLLDEASTRDTVRLGRLLSRFGIDQVVVVPHLAPAPFEASPVSGGAGIEDALAAQLDLRRVPGVPPLYLYLNVASNGPVVSLDQDSVPATATVSDLINVELASAQRVPLRAGPGGSWSGELTDEKLVVISTPGDGWRISGARDSVSDGLGGQLIIEPGPAGQVELARETPSIRRLLLGLQAALVLVGLHVGRGSRKAVR